MDITSNDQLLSLSTMENSNVSILDEDVSTTHSYGDEMSTFLDTMDNHTQSLWLAKYIGKTRCLESFAQDTENDTLASYCPRVWDNLLCWPPTPPEMEATLPCTDYPHFRMEGNASRLCQEDGTWFSNGFDTAEEIGWTNYTECLGGFLVESNSQTLYPLYEIWLPTIKILSVIGYSISLVTLIASFAILISLRRLRCPRNVLHLHLFASFIGRAVVVLLKTYTVKFEELPPSAEMIGGESMFSGGAGCKIFSFVWQYFILANYSWILMEGLYLHNLIFMALFSDSSAITTYICLGWGLPLVLACLWATLKAIFDDFHCWTVNHVQWISWAIIRTPVALSNLINFFFFVNVIRVLTLKMRSSISAESMKYKKLAKSTLVLLPLFGIHYFLLWGLSVSTNVKVEIAWLFVDQVLSSLQGFFVAVLYCLLNGEVQLELKKFYYRFRGIQQPTNPSYSTCVSNTRNFTRSTYGGSTNRLATDSPLGGRSPSHSPTPSFRQPHFLSPDSPMCKDDLKKTMDDNSATESFELRTRSFPAVESNGTNLKDENQPLLLSVVNEKDIQGESSLITLHNKSLSDSGFVKDENEILDGDEEKLVDICGKDICVKVTKPQNEMNRVVTEVIENSESNFM